MSKMSGFVTSPFTLTIKNNRGNNTIVRYTLDGSEPSLKSAILEEKLLIETASLKPFIHSKISTSPDKGPDQLWFFNWREPIDTPEKMRIVRLQLSQADSLIGPVYTYSYFIDQAAPHRFDIPVISLVVNPKDLFDSKTGIYVPGETFENTQWLGWWPPGNYCKKWRKKAHFSLFDKEGNRLVDEDVKIKIVGYGVAGFPQKSLKVQFDKKGAKNAATNQCIKGLSYNPKSILLRNSGQDFTSTLFRDVLNHHLAKELEIETQASSPSVVFINGEYWGIQNVRERIDKDYFKLKYGLKKTEFDLLEGCGDVKVGSDSAYQSLLKRVSDDKVSFSELEEQIDMNSLVDYLIYELYIGNYDWPSVNNQYWKSKKGKWRWILNDTDYSLSFDKMGMKNKDATFNAFKNATVEGDDVWPHNECATFLNRNIFKYEEFRRLFKKRYKDLSKSLFQSEKVVLKINKMQLIYEQEMSYHIKRWQYPMNKGIWYGEIEKMRLFFRQRPHYFQQHMEYYFAQF